MAQSVILALELVDASFYCRPMKWICGGLVMMTLCVGAFGREQDAATEERLKQLGGKVDDLFAAQEVQRKRLDELAQKIESLREELNKPAPPYAMIEDLKRLATSIGEVDRKRVEDNEKTRAKLQELINAITKLSATPPPEHHRPSPPPPQEEPPTDKDKDKDKVADKDKLATPEGSGDFIIHKVEPGETLLAIIAACREQHIKVTKKQILEANPGLKENSLRIGAKIRIPKPPPQ
jgi:LysM domain